MPFGLKNAPAVFQRKMDNIFKDLKKFVVVYIDDILVFSKDYDTHLGHLQLVFKKFIDHGLIVSKKKIELAKPEINFLGTIIGNEEIKLQPHIAQKILDMPDSFKDLKELQKFLGILNYARDYIPNLSRKARPLFAELRKTGQQHFNFQDTKLVKEIKEIVKTLQSFKLPLDSDYLIIQTDTCKLGWGAVLYCKPDKYSPKDSERMCRYASGLFKIKITAATEAEVWGVIEALHAFRLFVVSKPFTIRTDCEAMVSFQEKQKERRIWTRRRVHFESAIIGNGYTPTFEHIKGKENTAADFLSRMMEEEKIKPTKKV